MDVFNIIIVLLTSIIGGLYGGNVGGGAFLSFPVLIALGFPTTLAIGTLRMGGVFLGLTSSIRFAKEKRLNLKPALILGLFAATGAILGSNIVINLDENLINLVIAIIFTAAFFIILLNKKIGTAKRKLKIFQHPAYQYIAVLILGIYGGFFGAGFATLVMIFLAFLGKTFTESSALSKIIGFMMALSATLVFALYGLIDFVFAITLGIGYSIGAWIGISYALKKGNNFFRILLLFIIAATVVKLLYSILTT